MNYFDYLEMIDRNKASFAKCSVSAGDLASLESFRIVMTKTVKHNGRVISSESEEVTAYEYACTCSWTCSMKDRITRAYTVAGYLPVRFSARSPFTGDQHIREFQITNK